MGISGLGEGGFGFVNRCSPLRNRRKERRTARRWKPKDYSEVVPPLVTILG